MSEVLRFIFGKNKNFSFRHHKNYSLFIILNGSFTIKHVPNQSVYPHLSVVLIIYQSGPK